MIFATSLRLQGSSSLEFLSTGGCLVHNPDPTFFTDQVVIPDVIPKPSIELIEKPEDNQTQLSAIRKIIGKEISHAYPATT